MKIETVRQGKRVETPLTLQRAVEAYTEHRRGGDLGAGQKDALGRLDRWLQSSGVCARYNVEGHIQLDDLSRADAAKYVTWAYNVAENSAGTIKRTLTALNAIWNFAIEHFEKEDLKNPWKGLKPPKASFKENPEHLRLPFAKQHVEAIRRGLQGNRLKPEMRLIIRMMMCTGARPLELGGLLADEVFQDDSGVWINIQRNSIRDIKNSKTRRRVPIVDQALAADIWELAQKRNGGPLFQKGFHNTDNLSQRVTRFLREKCGIPKSTRLVPYSFRHTVTEALRVSEAPMDVTKAIVGHSDGSITENYGAGSVSLERMREALSAAMEKLGEVDLYHYKAEELMPEERGQ